MTPEKGLLKLKQLSSEIGWNFLYVHENLPQRMISDEFLIKLAQNDLKTINEAKAQLKNLFNSRGRSCK